MYAINTAAVFIRDQVRNIPALHQRLTDFVYTDIVKNHPPVLSSSESIDIIVRDNASVGRFGDGEYKMCRGKHLRFQRNSKQFTAKLCAVLYSNTPNFYAAIPDPKVQQDAGWRSSFVHNYRIICKLGSRIRLTSFIRSVGAQQDINNMQRIWENRKITLITNDETKQMADDLRLFGNAGSQHFIKGPATQAFAKYDDILQQANHQPQETLFVIALGPTATLLAYDLHLSGYQAVDIGHFIYLAHQTNQGE